MSPLSGSSSIPRFRAAHHFGFALKNDPAQPYTWGVLAPAAAAHFGYFCSSPAHWVILASSAWQNALGWLVGSLQKIPADRQRLPDSSPSPQPPSTCHSATSQPTGRQSAP